MVKQKLLDIVNLLEGVNFFSLGQDTQVEIKHECQCVVNQFDNSSEYFFDFLGQYSKIAFVLPDASLKIVVDLYNQGLLINYVKPVAEILSNIIYLKSEDVVKFLLETLEHVDDENIFKHLSVILYDFCSYTASIIRNKGLESQKRFLHIVEYKYAKPDAMKRENGVSG